MTKRIILDRRIVDDTWEVLEAGQEVPAGGDIIVPLALWRDHRATLDARAGRTGVWLKPDDEPGDLADDTAHLPVIAVQFPQFADGRGYSTARLLRQRYGFRGELRAIGDVLRDQVFYLARVGFNAFEIKAGKSIEEALTGFGDFSDAYQGAVDQPAPSYRRRLEAARA
jgi:uncharacterized protein (DUF934 family)